MIGSLRAALQSGGEGLCFIEQCVTAIGYIVSERLGSRRTAFPLHRGDRLHEGRIILGQFPTQVGHLGREFGDLRINHLFDLHGIGGCGSKAGFLTLKDRRLLLEQETRGVVTQFAGGAAQFG